MTVRVEKLHEPVLLKLTPELPEEFANFLGNLAIESNVERFDVPAGSKRQLQVPSLLQNGIVRAFEGTLPTNGELVIKEIDPGAIILNSLGYFPEADKNGGRHFPVTAEQQFQVLAKTVEGGENLEFLIYAVIRYVR
jgi:hypothetical protein